MEFIKNHKNIFIGIGAVIILFVVYAYLKDDSEQKPSLAAQTPVAPQSLPGSDIIALLVDLKAIKINSGFFTDQTFKSLIDFTTPLPSEPVGRTNPFAPVNQTSQKGVVSGVGAGKTQ